MFYELWYLKLRSDYKKYVLFQVNALISIIFSLVLKKERLSSVSVYSLF